MAGPYETSDQAVIEQHKRSKLVKSVSTVKFSAVR